MTSTPFPPGPTDHLFGLSLLKEVQTDVLTHCIKLAQQYGDSVHHKIGPVHVFQFTHPDQNHEVLVTHNRCFQKPKRFKQVLSQWNGKGLVVNEGESWVRQRRLVQPAFRPQRVASHISAVGKRVRRMLDGWTSCAEVDVTTEFSRLTLGVAAEALFGADVEQYTDRFVNEVAVLNETAIQELSSPWVLPTWAPTRQKRRMRKAIDFIDGLVRSIIRERRRNPKDHGDLLSMLLLAVDEEGDGGQMTDEQARDESVNLLLGGNETTATALMWTSHLLSQHPEIQEELREEAKKALENAPTSESIQKMRGIEMAVKESMRLYPPAYILPREAAENVQIGGYRVPQGSQVRLVPYVTQRDDRWFEDAEAFRPRRFASEDTFRKGIFLPFGAGPRACVGRSFAMMEAPLAIGMLLQRYRIAPLAHARPVEMEAQVSLHPKGRLKLAIEPC